MDNFFRYITDSSANKDVKIPVKITLAKTLFFIQFVKKAKLLFCALLLMDVDVLVSLQVIGTYISFSSNLIYLRNKITKEATFST